MSVLERPDTLRQSRIARFDSCPLSLKLEMSIDLRQLPGQIGYLGARGVLFHQFAARAMMHMVEHDESQIGVDQAMELLTEVIAQRDVPDSEVVHLPIRELRWLRVLVTKWTYRQRFSIHRVVAVEERLTHEIEVVGPGGSRYVRAITGKPDLLLDGPDEDEATVLDWKSGWAPPKRRKQPADGSRPTDKLSDMGYVQQVVYGFLVMLEFPSIQKVTLREFYVMEDEDPVRESTVERWEMERIQDVLAAQVAQIDAAIEAGPQSRRWFPVAGSHCGTCPAPRLCPIRDEFGIPTTLKEAQRLAREWIVAGQLRSERRPYLDGWVDHNGPIPIDHAKGRMEVGWTRNKTGSGRSFRMYEPDDAPDSPYDPLLEAAATEAGVVMAEEE